MWRSGIIQYLKIKNHEQCDKGSELTSYSLFTRLEVNQKLFSTAVIGLLAQNNNYATIGIKNWLIIH